MPVSSGNGAVTGAPLQARQRYWRRTRRLTGVLLLAWFGVTFVVAWYARELNSLNFFGWPFSFYMAAQGSLVVYLVLVVVYARSMDRLDRRFGVAEKDER